MGATVLPLAALLAWMRPAFAVRWRQTRIAVRWGGVLLWTAGAGLLFFFPHEDRFTGLDDMTYRQMAQAFAEGRGFHDSDAVMAAVPPALRRNFLLYGDRRVRPTRDRIFQLVEPDLIDAKPYFMPVLPLAAAGLEPVLSPERFVPLVGGLWLALVLAAGFCAGGGWGLLATGALVLGTAWPAWFFRGFFAEGVGVALIAGVVATAAVRPLRGGMAAGAGFALGLAISYHPTLVVLSGPVALGLMLEQNDRKTAIGVAVGLLTGCFPFGALTRWVCQPYGDWTRWATLKKMVFSVPEHQAVALALVLLAGGALLALCVGLFPAVRAWVRKWDEKLSPWGWLTICALPLLLVVAVPGGAGANLRSGAVSMWSGIRWPYALLLLVGAGSVWSQRRPFRERFWLAALCWTALLFLFVKGVETPVGLWSQRRFLPVVLVGIALLAAPASAALAGRSGARGKTLALGLLALAAGGANLIRWPAAYFTVNERGAAAWTESVAQRMGTDRWVVFDYYAHSVPYAAGLKPRVLGLGETAWTNWPAVAEWISSLAQTEDVWLVTSWSPCTLEDGLRLEPVFSATGRFPVVKTKAFFPAEPGERIVQNAFFRAVPLVPGELAVQDKTVDGSPVGLRGLWGPIRNGAAWTRQGSGIIGPIPERGGRVRIQIHGSWTPPQAEWSEQILRVIPPWGGEDARFEIPAGDSDVQGHFERPLNDGDRKGTGTYVFHVDRPYDPAENGVRGYPPDLGVQMRRIIIRVESSLPSVTD